jgi:hypothetical protein
LERGEDAHCLIESVKIRVCNAEVGLFRKTLKGPDPWRDLREDGISFEVGLVVLRTGIKTVEKQACGIEKGTRASWDK